MQSKAKVHLRLATLFEAISIHTPALTHMQHTFFTFSQTEMHMYPKLLQKLIKPQNSKSFIRLAAFPFSFHFLLGSQTERNFQRLLFHRSILLKFCKSIFLLFHSKIMAQKSVFITILLIFTIISYSESFKKKYGHHIPIKTRDGRNVAAGSKSYAYTNGCNLKIKQRRAW